jgi:acetolactate synthase-1/2/3 large subunit
MDSIPMVIISGQVPTHAIGEDAFQECDTVGITRPCVKHNFLVRDVKDLAMTMKKAFHIATTGRPGPVLVDIPKDVTANKCEFYPKPSHASYAPVTRGHGGQVKKALTCSRPAPDDLRGAARLGNARQSRDRGCWVSGHHT